MRLVLATAAALVVALVRTGAAPAHVTAEPSFLVAGKPSLLALTGPNERERPMTGFQVTMPPSIAIVHANPASGWEATVAGSTATWRGGSLAPGEEASFELELEPGPEPGSAELVARQLYADGRHVDWPVSILVVPGASSSSGSFSVLLAAGLVGLGAVGALAGGLWWRSRRRSLQER